MAKVETEKPMAPSSSCVQRTFWIVVALLALMFLLRLFGVKPLDKTVEEELIQKPHQERRTRE